jgi:mercuric ion transport protein
MPAMPAKSSLFALIVAMLAAIGASVCCVVPLALVLLGISGAWIAHLTAFDPWRPWFVAATILCLGLAFWSLYGPSSRCRREGVCVEPGGLRRRRFWLWAATALIMLLLLFPYVLGWFL